MINITRNMIWRLKSNPIEVILFSFHLLPDEMTNIIITTISTKKIVIPITLIKFIVIFRYQTIEKWEKNPQYGVNNLPVPILLYK